MKSPGGRLSRWSIGVESIYDDTLRRVNRGHDYAAFLDAMEMTRGRSIHIGAHLIVGFPWETREQWLAMADEMSRVGIDALKIHHLHWCEGPHSQRNTRVNRSGSSVMKSISTCCANSLSVWIRKSSSNGCSARRHSGYSSHPTGGGRKTISF